MSRPDAEDETVPVTTPAALPGPLRCRVATVSDLHIGLDAFGFMKTIKEDPRTAAALDAPPSIRCGRAALAEAMAWGADLVVVKGDLTDRGHEAQWEAAAALLAAVPVPVVVLPGNHDVYHDAELTPVEAGRRFGLHVVEGVEHVDLPGLRVVLAETAISGRSRGVLDAERAAEVAQVAAGGPAALVLLHHQLARRPEPPFWPPGLTRREGDRLLDGLAAAQPRSLVSSGHTHRHRRRTHGPVTVTTVGSTKDFPGVWAGYAVHDGGIRQVVRRVPAPDCLRWTERTRRGAAFQWARLSEGAPSARNFTLTWGSATERTAR